MRMLKSKWVITRKQHTCFGCCNRYSIGTKMHYFAGVIDGDFCSSYTCDLCNIIIKFQTKVQSKNLKNIELGLTDWPYCDHRYMSSTEENRFHVTRKLTLRQILV